MRAPFHNIYKNLTVLVTGHTGFKGSWLALWLDQLGAKVIGYSLPPATQPNHFVLTDLSKRIISIEGDIRNIKKLQETFNEFKPDIVFHLAAQPIVISSFEDPKSTFDINVGGSVNVLEAARHMPSVKAMVMITSDKCYDNQEWIWGYRESDKLGGSDPYSASKAMAELAIASYRQTILNGKRSYQPIAVASARAGNVIGGGDFSPFRLVPDCMRSLINHQPIVVRNPNSVRPWLFVLEPLSGYLWLGKKLLEEGSSFNEAWNFAPQDREGITVQTMVEKVIEEWGSGDWINASKPDTLGEMGLLRLCGDKASSKLYWRPTYRWDEALKATVDWFKAFTNKPEALYETAISQIDKYVDQASQNQQSWASLLEQMAIY